ncbi:sortase B protein-sorting domain-containing protein, partial [Bacillus paranthracis]|nr:sortase B protein-sorting domain-containing protein [Bacillus paranthracis]
IYELVKQVNLAVTPCINQDTAQLGLYMVLLLGSLALLVRKYRAGRL